MTGIPEGLILLVLTSIGVVAWWGIRRIVSGQDSIGLTLDAINDRLAHMEGRIIKVETRLDSHEREDDGKFEHVEKTTDALWHAARGK
jgi:hypothetical protein